MDVPVVILFGPTASGKTGLLMRLFGPGGLCEGAAEVVSADSMQVYRGMDIGTAKPSPEERALLPHHLIDIRNPDEQFNAGDFVRLADEACIDIARRGKIPVVSGGTGFYLKNFILGLPEAPPSDPEIRAALRRDLREKGAAFLMDELASGDPVSAGRIHLNDEYRLVRALEVLRLSGSPLSSFQKAGSGAAAAGGRPLYRFLIIGISLPREELYRRINLRCAAMFNAGLACEVRRLYEAGFTPNDPGLRAIGYREFFVEEPTNREELGIRNGELGMRNERGTGDKPSPGAYRISTDLAGLEVLIAQNSRRYAKRQITFFASLPEVKWVAADPLEAETVERIRREVEDFL